MKSNLLLVFKITHFPTIPHTFSQEISFFFENNFLKSHKRLKINEIKFCNFGGAKTAKIATKLQNCAKTIQIAYFTPNCKVLSNDHKKPLIYDPKPPSADHFLKQKLVLPKSKRDFTKFKFEINKFKCEITVRFHEFKFRKVAFCYSDFV